MKKALFYTSSFNKQRDLNKILFDLYLIFCMRTYVTCFSYMNSTVRINNAVHVYVLYCLYPNQYPHRITVYIIQLKHVLPTILAKCISQIPCTRTNGFGSLDFQDKFDGKTNFQTSDSFILFLMFHSGFSR